MTVRRPLTHTMMAASRFAWASSQRLVRGRVQPRSLASAPVVIGTSGRGGFTSRRPHPRAELLLALCLALRDFGDVRVEVASRGD